MTQQHDYILANADGATFRADLNNVLLAIVKQNAGASEPLITFPYMFWYDTTNGILKQRNGANSAWLDRFYDAGATGQPGARKNVLINPDFNIWQRGTSFAAIANSAYSADMYKYVKVGAMVHTVSRQADVPTVGQSGHYSNYSLQADCTTVDSSIAAGDYCAILQKVEGYNYLQIANQTFTLSFWHKHTKTGTYCIALQNSGADRSYLAEYTQAVSDTWEKATIVISSLPSGGTWDYTTGVGLSIIWTLACGTTFQSTVDTWNSGNFFATSNQVNACDNTANNFMLAQVQLELGGSATNLESRDYISDLGFCQRYLNKTYNVDVDPGTTTEIGALIGASASTNAAPGIVNWRYPTVMRANPTVTFYSTTGASGKCRKLDGTPADVDAVLSLSTAGTQGCSATVNAAVTANERYAFHMVATAAL